MGLWRSSNILFVKGPWDAVATPRGDFGHYLLSIVGLILSLCISVTIFMRCSRFVQPQLWLAGASSYHVYLCVMLCLCPRHFSLIVNNDTFFFFQKIFDVPGTQQFIVSDVGDWSNYTVIKLGKHVCGE
jgi:hypothetical protein